MRDTDKIQPTNRFEYELRDESKSQSYSVSAYYKEPLKGHTEKVFELGFESGGRWAVSQSSLVREMAEALEWYVAGRAPASAKPFDQAKAALEHYRDTVSRAGEG